MLEIPSGAWADLVDRRLLLVVSGLVYALAFASWICWPGYLGFALGFVLWGASSAAMSGAFEALVYDELAHRGEAARYAGLMGAAQATAMVANLVATAAAAPLFAWGGYRLVGWASVAMALVHAGLALTLPRPRPVEGSDDTAVEEPCAGGVLGRYAAMVWEGLGEVARRPVIRRSVLIAAATMGLLSYDEYFPLVLREGGVETARVPVLVAAIVAAQAVGTALAGRAERLSGRAVGAGLVVAAVLMTVGTLGIGYGGVAAIAVGYGMVSAAVVVAEARLQHAIEGRARATVTSVLGFSSEVVAIGVYATVAVGASWWSFTAIVAALGAPSALLGLAVRRWMPDLRR